MRGDNSLQCNLTYSWWVCKLLLNWNAGRLRAWYRSQLTIRLNIYQLISNLFTVFKWFMYYLAVLLAHTFMALLNTQLTLLCLLLWLFILNDCNGNIKPSILLVARLQRLVWSLVCSVCCLFTFGIEEADLLNYELNVSLATRLSFHASWCTSWICNLCRLCFYSLLNNHLDS